MERVVENHSLNFELADIYCCDNPKYIAENGTLHPKLHQSRAIVEYECENCGSTVTDEYFLDRKETRDGVLDKDVMDIPSPNKESCEHVFRDQTAYRDNNGLYVVSKCDRCELVVEDIFEHMNTRTN